jgi:hypothetical protein
MRAVCVGQVMTAITSKVIESPPACGSIFSMFTTFGTPQDVTLASLRVEHMFAAVDATRAVIRSQVP